MELASPSVLGLTSPSSSGASLPHVSLTFTQASLKKLLKCLRKAKYFMIPFLMKRSCEILLLTDALW